MEENQHIEWKETWKDEYLKWVCGFANAQGGILVIGKNDKDELIGLKKAKLLLEEIPNKIKDILGVIADVDLKNENGLDYLEIRVEAYPYPVNYKGQYHYRSGSTKQELTGSALNSFLLKKYGIHWDGVPVPNLLPEMLEKSAFTLFTEKAVRSNRLDKEILTESRISILEKLHLFEGAYIKRAAALLFYEDPEQFVTGAYIKIGFFRTDSDLVYQDEIHGNLFQQVDKTIDLLLTKYMKAYISYEGIQRVEQYLFPAPALREALLNAIVHKDYSSGNPLQISVYENQIIFWNAGKLPEELSIESLQRKHPSIPNNPHIASAFFRAGYIEAWGRGIEKINNECITAKVPVPEFNYLFGGMMITFKTDNQELLTEVQPIKSIRIPKKTSERIIELIETNSNITIPEIADIIGISTRAIEKQIEKLQKEKRLERIGSKKIGQWKKLDDKR
ncbi:MAG TPA: transcriptional regulator [Prolixibacteraceae bacterium]|nr:transcriptional regulator [Prolixibacteraceae bacterium]